MTRCTWFIHWTLWWRLDIPWTCRAWEKSNIGDGAYVLICWTNGATIRLMQQLPAVVSCVPRYGVNALCRLFCPFLWKPSFSMPGALVFCHQWFNGCAWVLIIAFWQLLVTSEDCLPVMNELYLYLLFTCSYFCALLIMYLIYDWQAHFKRVLRRQVSLQFLFSLLFLVFHAKMIIFYKNSDFHHLRITTKFASSTLQTNSEVVKVTRTKLY